MDDKHNFGAESKFSFTFFSYGRAYIKKEISILCMPSLRTFDLFRDKDSKLGGICAVLILGQ